jgi:hypothetical protein
LTRLFFGIIDVSELNRTSAVRTVTRAGKPELRLEGRIMAVVWVLIWLGTSIAAYFMIEAACRCCGGGLWDGPIKEFTAVCSILLGPVLLVIAVELLLLAVMGSGLTQDHTHIYKD